MGAIAFHFIQGFTLGHSFIQSKRSEDEVKRGQNDYFGAFYQGFQVMDVMNICSIAAERAPYRYRIPFQIFCSVIYCLAVPAQFFCVINREGHYESFAVFWNSCVVNLHLPMRLQLHRSLANLHLPKIPSKLNLGNRSVRVIDFLVRCTGTMATIAMAVGNLMIIYQGKTALAVGTLFAVAFDIAHRRLLWIPRKIVLFFENNMPLISTIVGIFQGIWIGRGKNLLQALTYKKSIYLGIQHRCDDFLRARKDETEKRDTLAPSRPLRPTLREIDAPWERRDNLSYDDIIAVLSAEDQEFEINFAASSKSVGAIPLPEDRDFGKLLALFETIDWLKKCPLISGKLKRDERFLKDHLLPELAKIDSSFLKKSHEDKDFQANFDSNVDKLIQHKKVPKETYLAEWVRSQMKYLVAVLKGEKNFEGKEEDRQVVISRCAKIIPYLESSTAKLTEEELKEFQRNKEDFLLKLAVDCGGYCGIQVKRIPGEILDQIDESLNPPQNDLEAYEQKILRTLERRRKQIVENDWGAMAQHISNNSKQLSLKTNDFISTMAILAMKDLHAFENFKFRMGMGFYPMTDSERVQLNFVDFLFWRFNYQTVWVFVAAYQRDLDTITQETGDEFAFNQYILGWINSLTILPDVHKEAFISKFQDIGDHPAAILHKFKRLLFYRLGILNRKPTFF